MAPACPPRAGKRSEASPRLSRLPVGQRLLVGDSSDGRRRLPRPRRRSRPSASLGVAPASSAGACRSEPRRSTLGVRSVVRLGPGLSGASAKPVSENGGRAGQRGQHLPDVGQLGVDAVAALGGGGELALGVGCGSRSAVALASLTIWAASSRASSASRPASLAAWARVCLGVGAGALGELARLVEPGLGLGHLLGELVLGRAAASGQRGLEVGGRLRGPGALLLVDGLGLLQPDRRVALGAVAVLVGGLAGVLHDPGGLGVGLAVDAGGVAVGLLADPRGAPACALVRWASASSWASLAQLGGLGVGQRRGSARPGSRGARSSPARRARWSRRCSSSTRAASPSRCWVRAVTAAVSSSSRRSTSAGS